MIYKKRDKNDLDYLCDGSGELLYWDTVARERRILVPARPILDVTLCIGKIGQQNLLSDHFTFKPKDCKLTFVHSQNGEQIGEPILPGISSYLFWGSKEANQSSPSDFTQNFLGRKYHSKNRVYIAMVGDILSAGWVPYFAPLIDSTYPVSNPLHVVLVPDSISSGVSCQDAFPEEKIEICKSFVKWL